MAVASSRISEVTCFILSNRLLGNNASIDMAKSEHSGVQKSYCVASTAFSSSAEPDLVTRVDDVGVSDGVRVLIQQFRPVLLVTSRNGA